MRGSEASPSSPSSPSLSGCPVVGDAPDAPYPAAHPMASDVAASGCPVIGSDTSEKNLMPKVANNAPLFPEQTKALDVHRQVSSIPTGSTEAEDRWIYPSPQMFYNAMKRKGWTPAEEVGVVFSSVPSPT